MSKATKKPAVGAMVLCHHRPWLLSLIVEQYWKTWPGDCVVHFMADRPNAAVIAELAKLEAHPAVKVFTAGFPAVGGVENFMALRQCQLQFMQQENTRFICIHDDDHVLENPKEAADKTRHRHYDLIYAKKTFFWDDLEHVNCDLPVHNSVFFFRNLEGDRFPMDRMIHAPWRIHDKSDKKVTQMKSTLLDIGYLYPEQREEVFRRYARAGKLDAATLPLTSSTPTLAPYDKKGPWLDKLRKILP